MALDSCQVDGSGVARVDMDDGMLRSAVITVFHVCVAGAFVIFMVIGAVVTWWNMYYGVHNGKLRVPYFFKPFLTPDPVMCYIGPYMILQKTVAQ